MRKNAKDPVRFGRGGSAVAAGVLTLVLMLGSGGTWAAAADDVPVVADASPASTIQQDELAGPETPSPTTTEGDAKVTEAQTPQGDTADADESTAIDTIAPVVPSPQTEAEHPEKADSLAPVDKRPDVVAPEKRNEKTEEVIPAENEDGGIATLAVGDGALVWTVKDERDQPVRGATIRVQGPATYSFWSGVTWDRGDALVEDCVLAPCSGLDRDPAAGQFRVTELNTRGILSDSRYRVQPQSEPAGYKFVTATDWIEIPGSRAVPTSNPWPNDEWHFQNFLVNKLPSQAPKCTPGYVYGLSDDGWIRQVAPGTSAATNFGSKASGVTSFNGLGIGSAGERVFAYERSNASGNQVSSAAIWAFNTEAGTWSSSKVTVNSNTSGRTVAFVGGAVDLSTGLYYLGGFTADGALFRLWEYDPVANVQKYKGHIDTAAGYDRWYPNNGDLAFNASGELFVVRGQDAKTTVFSVTKANFQAANGGLIAAADSKSVTTMANVNGVAFDASGKAYLGSEGMLRSYDMPSWTSPKNVVSSNLNSTDLATCSSPATVTLEKDIPSGRSKASDQFKLELKQGTNTLGVATTTGNASGVQEERVGPLPVAPGSVLTFSEAFVGKTNSADYAPSWSCTSDGDPLAKGNGTSGSVTIPYGADAVVCRVTNQLLIATVKVHKEVEAVDGTRSDGAGWTVGAGVTATTGTASPNPTSATQVTNASGDAAWTVRLNDKNGRATIKVFEQMQSGFAFVEGACYVESFDGSSSESVIENPAGLVLKDIGPGDTVTCEFLNKQLPASVQVNKQWTIDGGKPVPHGEQPAGLTAVLGLDPKRTGTPVWGEVQAGYAINDQVTIGETAAVDKAALPGCSLGDPIISGPGITGSTPLGTGRKVTLTQASNSYTITNPVTCKQTLTLNKSVVDTFSGQRLPKDWKLGASDWDGGLSATTGTEDSLIFDSGEAKTIDQGKYVLAEVDKDNYLFSDLTCSSDVLEASSKTVTVGLGQNVTCTFVNKDAPGSVTWTKVDEAGALLDGSEWKIASSDGDISPILDCVADNVAECTGLDKDPGAGKFRVDGLAWGGYELVETMAPAGYLINKGPHEFTISKDHLSHAFDAIVNEQRGAPIIPMTGGLGSYQFWIVAGLFGGLTGGGLLWQRRTQRRATLVGA